MLWKKESHEDDALYMNILALCSRDLNANLNRLISMEINSQPTPQKSDALALIARNEGNAFYRIGAWGPAMESYSESLCLAKPGSENISLAYANRSICFLKLNMFAECLKDIELAKETGYPEHLMPKLDQRKDFCLKNMKCDFQPHVAGAKMKFEPDDKFPCLANVLKVQKNNTNSYSIIAKEDIDANETVVVENAFQTNLFKRFGLKCNICLKGFTNLIPCKRCAVAMFCEGCQNHILHEYECGLNMCGPGALNAEALLRVRLILSAINTFPDVESLMNFVEDLIRCDANKLPEALVTPQSKYQVVFKTTIPYKFNSINELAQCIHPVYTTVLSIPKIKAMFRSVKHLRFLQHLIGHHSSTSVCKVLFSSSDLKQSPIEEFDDPMMYSNQIDLMKYYFRHSCMPNVLCLVGDGQFVYVTAQTIKQGEELLIQYIVFYSAPTNIRQEILMDHHHFTCVCARCKGITASRTKRQELATDPSFRFITHEQNDKRLRWPFTTHEEIDESIQHCVKLLRKYGRMNWCDELKTIHQTYLSLLFIRVFGRSFSHKSDPILSELLPQIVDSRK